MTEAFEVPERETERLLWVGLDLDGTLAESVWPARGIGRPIRLAVVKVKELIAKGYKPVLYSARPWSDYEMVEAWLAEHDIPITRILLGKPLFAAFVDDKNLLISEASWLPR